MSHAYRNTIIFIILVLAGVQWGFYYNYTSKFPEFKGVSNLTHIHGMLMMSWLILLIVQPLLIMTGKQKLHRTIGKSSYVLGPLIIATLFLIGRHAYHSDLKLAPEHINLAVRALDIRGFFSFAIFWSLAMINRKNSDAHMRYMIGTGILAIGPGIGRGLMGAFNLSLWDSITITDSIDMALALILLGFDVFRNKNYKPYLVILLVMIASALLWQFRLSAPWQAFAGKWADLFY
jgi:hypothetical protein